VISANPKSIPANGKAHTTITVEAKDASGQPLRSSGGIVKLWVPVGHLSPISDNHDGTYTATLTSTGFPTTVSIGGTIGGSPIGSLAMVTFTKSTGGPPTTIPPGKDEMAPIVAPFPSMSAPGKPLKLVYVPYDNSGFAKRTIRVYRHNQTLFSAKTMGRATGKPVSFLACAEADGVPQVLRPGFGCGAEPQQDDVRAARDPEVAPV